jgi:GntR family transcriptional regulator
MQILADSGLVERARKLGTRVLRREPASSYIQRLSNLNDTLGFGGDTIMRIDDVQDVSDPDEPALQTEVSTTGHWLQITGVRYLPGEQDAPTTWSRVFVSGPFSGIRPLVNGELGAIYSLIEKSYGIRVTRLRHRISAIALPDRAAQALNLPAGIPALRVDAWLYAADRTLVEFVCSIHDPARFSLAFETESISP